MEEVRTPLPTTARGSKRGSFTTRLVNSPSPHPQPLRLVLWVRGESFSTASYFRWLAITYFLCFLFGLVVSAKQNRTEGNSWAFFSLPPSFPPSFLDCPVAEIL